jgi:hypothetical protein
MTTPRIEVTPLLRMAIRSFGRARSALVGGRVDEMIGQLTRGVELLDVINQCERRSARRRSTRKSAS